VTDANKDSLLHSFYDMRTSYGEAPQNGMNSNTQLVHSIHNTGRQTTKAALVSSAHYEDALGQFSHQTNILVNYIPADYLANILIPGKPPTISGQTSDSISSCNYSSYATDLLSTFISQDDSMEQQPRTTAKWFCSTHMTYVSIISPLVQAQSAPPTVFTLSNSEVDKLFDAFSKKLQDTQGQKVSIFALKAQVTKTSEDIKVVQDYSKIT
jgi:hypothetical protein